MSNVFNDTKEMQKIQTVLDLLKQSGTRELDNLINLIEESKNSGNLEPENYEQLVSSEYLGNEFKAAHHETYNENIQKMQQFLMELEKKLNEYLQIN